MAAINWDKTTNNFKENTLKIDSNVTRTDWVGYFEALGWMEGRDKYSANNGLGYYGIYQVGQVQLDYLNFELGVGSDLFGEIPIYEFKDNPIAQEIVNLMSFSGIPDVGGRFVSRFTATRIEFDNISGRTREQFFELVGKTTEINYVDANGVVGSHTVTLTAAGISAAAHLVGQGTVAAALSKIYDQNYNANGTRKTSGDTLVATLSALKYADGNDVLFGGADNDTLVGDTGIDQLYGGQNNV